MPKNSPLPNATARLAAFDLLRLVLVNKKAFDDAMTLSRAYQGLDGPDKGFAAYLARTALRRLGQIDDLIAHCVRDPLPRKARPVYDVLRIGITQLLFASTADHAAVATTVDLCRDAGQIPFAKLVNAVMRRLQREGEGLVRKQNAAALNTPDWLRQSWVGAYGEATADAIAAQHLETPPLDLTVKSDAAGWAEKLSGTVVLNGSVRLSESTDVAALPGFDAGEWWVQDAAARLASRMAGDVAGKTVIDLCAAPGGKTLELAAAGANVTALDISEKRLARLSENLTRTGLSATVVAADARDWSPESPADVVVLDAPCSSTGTLRRHPDVAWLKTPDDVAKLSGVQAGLLDAAARMVAPGGVLVYVTCSLQPEEGPDAVAAFLKRTPSFNRMPIGVDEAGGLGEAVSPDGDLRTLPCFLSDMGGMDGFFAARLKRQA